MYMLAIVIFKVIILILKLELKCDVWQKAIYTEE